MLRQAELTNIAYQRNAEGGRESGKGSKRGRRRRRGRDSSSSNNDMVVFRTKPIKIDEKGT